LSKRNAAVALAKMGFLVFPVESNGKKPVIDNWTERAISDPQRVYDWWTEATGEERDYNIGVCCNNLLVVDIDTKGEDKPYDVLAKMEKEYGVLFVVETPSSGYHVYFRLPEGVRVGNTAKKFGPTIDTRSWHGYVLGPGSAIDGKLYAWVESRVDGNRAPASVAEIPAAPSPYIEGSERPKDKAPVDASIEWDAPAAIAKATNYIKDDAPSAEKGSRGITAYRIACRCRDYAVSESAALTLMADGWNVEGRVDPPMSIEELVESVEHAYAYAQNAPVSPGSEFDAVEGVAKGETLPKGCPIFSLEGPIDISMIPKREWLVEGVFARGFVTLINAPPGSGKTQWLAQLLLSVTHNRPDVGGFPVVEPTRAWSFNAEDDLNELRRRIAGTIIHYKLSASTFGFALSSGIESEFCVAKWDASKQSVTRNEKAIAAFTRQIIENKVGLVILDPMADIHEVPESSNDAIKTVVRIFTKIAIDAHCAIGIATHARKLQGASAEGHAGNADSVRGGGAQVAKARVVMSLMPMTEKECKAGKVDPETRGSYLRIDTAKNNLGPTDRGAKPTWFRWTSVLLDNGDKVGVLEPAEIVTSRLRQEIDRSEVLASILATMPEAEKGVSWSRAVLSQFVKKAAVSESYAKKWFSSLETETETSLGVVTKIDKTGPGGALLRLTDLPSVADDDDVFA
jgi:RecA-family ATPase